MNKTSSCNNTIHFRYSEIGLKGQNLYRFEQVLLARLREIFLFHDIPLQKIEIKQKQGRIILRSALPANSLEQDLHFLSLAPGIKWWGICLYRATFKDIKDITENIYNFLRQEHLLSSSLNIDIRRYDKSLDFTSNDVWIALAKLLKQPGQERNSLKGNLKLKIFIYSGYYEVVRVFDGIGGLPVGASGKGLVLFSGGIDSPVAAFLAARRGIKFDLLHFTPYSKEQIKESKIYDIWKKLQEYNPSARLYIGSIPFIKELLVKQKLGALYNPMIFFKRLIFKLAEMHAKKLYKQDYVLISGDSLGQVASQTISNIIATQDILDKDTLVIRPCIGLTKEEIIGWAKRIGTYELSIRSYDDCCSLLAVGSKTITNLEKMHLQDSKFNLSEILEEAYKTIQPVV